MSAGLQLLRATIESGARSEFRQLEASLFSEEEAAAFGFVSAHYRRHGALPSIATCAEEGFALPPASEPPVFYLERVRARSIFNTVASQNKALGEAMRRRDANAIRQVIAETHAAISKVQAKNDVSSLHEVVAQVMADYEATHASGISRGITLGWDYLDGLTNGAEPGDIITFVARPGMGKSWFLTHIARKAWHEGASILLVSMEMKDTQIVRRYIGMEAGFNPEYIRKGQLSRQARDAAYGVMRNAESGAPFHILHGSFESSVSAVDAAIMEFSPDLVLIDASYLMSPSDRRGNKKQFELLTAVGTELKEVALHRNKPIIQTVQFNREAKKAKTPDLIHIGGSDAIGQISTVAVAIGPGEGAKEGFSRKLSVIKNREGPSNESFFVDFLFTPPKFDFIGTTSEDAQDQEENDDYNATWAA